MDVDAVGDIVVGEVVGNSIGGDIEGEAGVVPIVEAYMQPNMPKRFVSARQEHLGEMVIVYAPRSEYQWVSRGWNVLKNCRCNLSGIVQRGCQGANAPALKQCRNKILGIQ